MDKLIGESCTFSSESVKTSLADGLVKYVLFHNDRMIRPRTDHLSYLSSDPSKDINPYPTDKYYTYDEKNIKQTQVDKKTPKSVEEKEHKAKFISIGPMIKKWLATLCSRLAYECDAAYNDLNIKLLTLGFNSQELDNVMFSKNLDINLFKLIAKVVSQHEYLLQKRMSDASGLEVLFASKYFERYELHHPTRKNNKTIADWLAKLTDDFFKVLACYISSKNWYDRDATLVEKNFAWILWQLSENTQYDVDLGKFIHEMRLNLNVETVVDTTNLVTLDFTQLSDQAKKIEEMKVEQKKKGRTSKKAEPNKSISGLSEALLASSISTNPALLPSTVVPPVPIQSIMPMMPNHPIMPNHPMMPNYPMIPNQVRL